MIKTYERCNKCMYSNMDQKRCNFYQGGSMLILLEDQEKCIRYINKEVQEKEIQEVTKMTVDQSVYRKNIVEKLDKQIQKGIDKYGTTLEQNTWFTAMDRLTYLQEELIDGLVYIEHIKAKLEKLNVDLD